MDQRKLRFDIRILIVFLLLLLWAISLVLGFLYKGKHERNGPMAGTKLKISHKDQKPLRKTYEIGFLSNIRGMPIIIAFGCEHSKGSSPNGIFWSNSVRNGKHSKNKANNKPGGAEIPWNRIVLWKMTSDWQQQQTDLGKEDGICLFTIQVKHFGTFSVSSNAKQSKTIKQIGLLFHSFAHV